MIHLVPADGTADGSNTDRPVIGSLATGVPGLDTVLGGGLPEFSFNLVAGGPGVGKTTMVQQIVFNNATVAHPALYFTVLGEPTLKMIRYQRQFGFFQPGLVGSAVRFINLTEEVLREDLAAVLQRMVDEVERARPGIVVVDSFRTLGLQAHDRGGAGKMGLEQFTQRLALHLTTWEVTSFLIGEYVEPEVQNPIFTVADGIIWLSQPSDGNSVVRKLQVVKVRGRPPMPGFHTFRLTDGGVRVFPRILQPQKSRQPRRAGRLGERRSCCFQLRNVRNRSDRGYRGRIEGHIDLDLSQQLALAVEYLDTPIAPVRDVDVALRIGGDAVRRIELARLVAGLAPRHKPFAILISFRHS